MDKIQFKYMMKLAKKCAKLEYKIRKYSNKRHDTENEKLKDKYKRKAGKYSIRYEKYRDLYNTELKILESVYGINLEWQRMDIAAF